MIVVSPPLLVPPAAVDVNDAIGHAAQRWQSIAKKDGIETGSPVRNDGSRRERAYVDSASDRAVVADDGELDAVNGDARLDLEAHLDGRRDQSARVNRCALEDLDRGAMTKVGQGGLRLPPGE